MQQYLTPDYIELVLVVLAFLVACKFIVGEISKCRKASFPNEFKAVLIRRYAVSIIPMRQSLERSRARQERISAFMKHQVELEAGGQDTGQMIYHLVGPVIFCFIAWFLIVSEAPLLESAVTSIFHIDTGSLNISSGWSTQDFVRQYSWGLLATVLLGPILLLDIFGMTHIAPWFTSGSKLRRALVTLASIASCTVTLYGLLTLYSIQNAETYHATYAVESAASSEAGFAPGTRLDLESQIAGLSRDEEMYVPDEAMLNRGILCLKVGLHAAIALALVGAFHIFRVILLALTVVFAWLPNGIMLRLKNKRLEILNVRLDRAAAKLNLEISQGQQILRRLKIEPPAGNVQRLEFRKEETHNDESPEDNVNDDGVNFNNQPGAGGFDPFGALSRGEE